MFSLIYSEELTILLGNIFLNTYKKTLNLNNYGSLFKVYSDGSPGKIRTCDTSVNSRVLLPLSY